MRGPNFMVHLVSKASNGPSRSGPHGGQGQVRPTGGRTAQEDHPRTGVLKEKVGRTGVPAESHEKTPATQECEEKKSSSIWMS